ncbi:MAG: peptide deformylase [Patescibacteria group bacterium]|nr:peptide deformylase [Patescibacteria group bacterium]
MSILRILTDRDPILRKKCAEVDDVSDPFIRGLVLNMRDTLEKHKGIGLAAPQVGVNKRVILVKLWREEYVLINPRLTSASREKEMGEEGCLSLPGVFLNLERSKKVRVKALDQNGKKIKMKAKGLLARVLQHEIDHLEGILINDRVKD